MSSLPPEELSREIDRLWARVGSSSPDSAGGAPATGGGADLAWETVSLLKTQQRRRESALAEALEAKENALRHWRARAESLVVEVEELRLRASGGEQRIVGDLLESQRRLEDASAALELEKRRHDEERNRLEALLAETRERLNAEAARAREADARFAKREQQSLIDLKDMQDASERRQREAAQADASVRALKAGLAEAKNALEKTLSELLLERQERHRVEAERDRSVKKTDEVQKHLDELQKLWEEERAQWRELWDRERSTWEAQRQELAQWEESLRKEREAWHAELQQREKTHLALNDGLAGKIRETTMAAEQAAEKVRALETEGDAARRAVREAFVFPRLPRRRVAWALACAALLFAAPRAWRWSTAWTFTRASIAPAPGTNPAALSFDGERLWLADWSGRLLAADPADPRRALRDAAPAAEAPYRPAALASGAGMLWTLDAAQARVLRLSAAAPEKALAVKPSPGPAPAAAAFDGETLWTYDAASRALYKHSGDETAAKSWPMGEDVVPNAMAWVDGRLWVHDSKAARIAVYALDGGRLELKESHPAPDRAVLGLAAGPREGRSRTLWLLLGPSPERPQPSLARYSVRRRLPLAKF